MHNAASLVAQAHDELRRFFRLTEERPALLSAPWRMLICFSYYCAHDLPQWTELLAGLNDKMEASHTRRPSRASGNVILMGPRSISPIIKSPFCFKM